MPIPRTLPSGLGLAFSVTRARSLGLTTARLRASDLERPFHGVRLVRGSDPTAVGPGEAHELRYLADRYRRSLEREKQLIRAVAQRLQPGHFFSHRTAALLWGAPMPHLDETSIHVSALRPVRAPRTRGVTGHSFIPERCGVTTWEGLALTDAPTTWVSLGAMSLLELVVVGDYLVRRFRPGHGRPNAGRPPFATVQELAAMLELGRWQGASRLRRALALIREDSWSPRETMTRLQLVRAGLPEPALNRDVFDSAGRFLACLDMAYLEYFVAVEYQGELHQGSYAHDIERIERLRAAGWIVIQVSRVLAADPAELVRRVEAALRSRGWRG